MAGRRGAVVATGVAVAVLGALLAWRLLRDDPRPPAAAPHPAPTATPTPVPEPRKGPCADQSAAAFVPTRVTIPGVVRRAEVIGVPRTPAGVVGVLSHADNQDFAWDLGGVEAGADEGHVLINTHTWPNGAAMGNRLLDRLRVGGTVRLEAAGRKVACYRVVTRDEVPAEKGYPGWAAKEGPHQLVIVVCSGKRLGPGRWTHRTLWFADPADSPASPANPTPPS